MQANDLIKIGSSAFPENRIQEIARLNPKAFELAIVPGGRELEKELHLRHAAAQEKGEWFRVTPKLIQDINRLSGYVNVDRPTAPYTVRREVAEKAGVPDGTISKVKVIAEKAPEAVKEKLRKGESTINKEFKAIVNAERKEQQLEEIRKFEDQPQPDGKFQVFIVDPPWAYTKRAADPTHRGASPYPPMTRDEIVAFFRQRVIPKSDENTILWLWTTNAFMAQAHDVAAAAGFEVKTILTWAKDRIGVGDWLRGQTEHCLMAIRGKPVVTLTNQSTLLQGKAREHSRKPEEFYALLKSLCPGAKCEFFARERRDGIVAFGVEPYNWVAAQARVAAGVD